MNITVEEARDVLESLPVKELRTLQIIEKIKGRSKMRKDELIKNILKEYNKTQKTLSFPVDNTIHDAKLRNLIEKNIELEKIENNNIIRMNKINIIRLYLIKNNIIKETKLNDMLNMIGSLDIKKYKKDLNILLKNQNITTPIEWNKLNNLMVSNDIQNDLLMLKTKDLSDKKLDELLKKYHMKSQDEYIKDRHRVYLSTMIKKFNKKI